jgi:hypothetical protein
MRRLAIWHGTPEETAALLQAINRFCAGKGREGDYCPRGSRGERLGTCAAHALLLDQRALDGLLWMRRMAPRLVREEHQTVGHLVLQQLPKAL